MKSKAPNHIAIIMDGNGRWARKRGLPKIMGHRSGVDSVRKIVKACIELDIKILTLYTFSTENWKRPKREVDGLMRLLERYLKKEYELLNKEGVRLNVLGDIDGLPNAVQRELRRVMDLTCSNKKLLLNMAINYGSRSEIVTACRSIAEGVEDGRLCSKEIDETLFSKYLYTGDLPDPDLLIRTSGEMRVSNFLLWQISYSEIVVSKKLWPDFRKKDLQKAIADFRARQRRFGG